MAIGTSRTARDIAFTLEVKSPKIFENIFLNNGVLVLLGSNGRVKIVRGGNRFDERVHLGQNSNVDHRSKFAEIPTDFQNNFQTAQYGQAVISGAVPINLVEQDQNMGAQRISSMTDALIEELKNTFANKVSDGLMATTSASTDPLSIKEELPATAFGSQTRTTGGIARSDYPGTDETAAWQTRYDGTTADISAATGIAIVSNALWSASDSSAKDMQPDIGLVTTGVMAKASGGGDVLRRYGVNDRLLKLRYDNLMIGNAALIADRSAGAKNGFFLNTNFMHAQVLAGSKTQATGSIKVIGDGATSVPLQVSKPIEADNFLNFTIKAYLVYNVTFGGLKQQLRMDDLTEA